MRRLLLALFWMALAANALNAYQTEFDLDADISFAEVENENGDANIGLGFDGTFFLQDVKTDNVPLEEAAFLAKSSSIGLKFGYKADYHGLSRRFEETEVGSYKAIKGKAVVNDYILKGSYAYAKLTDDGDVDNITQKRLLLGFGRYLTDTSTLLVSYVRYEDSRKYHGLNLGFTDREDNGVDIAYKGLNRFENGQSISYGGNFAILNSDIIGITDSDYTYEYGAHISYYPSRYWMLKADAAIKSFDTTDFKDKRQAYNLSTRYYFVESFAMDVNFGHIKGEDELGEVKGLIVGLGFRLRF